MPNILMYSRSLNLSVVITFIPLALFLFSETDLIILENIYALSEIFSFATNDTLLKHFSCFIRC